ncbi:BlaI/MecI/CopY family transcriptional regulator [Robiginitomaculum antarcticum]|uniref:BlaI/MecI/CopY family transcriptional regulator n=1 Tax=Robiginitomaculum antarcticum TaxID=437507 RepID=UPI000368B9CA|nr:BlaI/MecI/CopY family transcriptional regulator [Robiginitomaculum antarcticum]
MTLPNISEAEMHVMDVLWREHPLAAADIAQRLDAQDWSQRTVKTLLSRLVEKGAVGTKPQGRRFLYSPAVERGTVTGRATRHLADRLFGGRAAPLVAHLAEGKGLSDDDIAELEALIAELKS